MAVNVGVEVCACASKHEAVAQVHVCVCMCISLLQQPLRVLPLFSNSLFPSATATVAEGFRTKRRGGETQKEGNGKRGGEGEGEARRR